MLKRARGPLRQFLIRHEVGQNALARGILKSSGYLSQLANDDTGASHDTIDAILAWLSVFLARKVTYEEVFQGRRGVKAASKSIQRSADQAAKKVAVKRSRAEAHR